MEASTWILEYPTELLLICLGLIILSASYWKIQEATPREDKSTPNKIPRSKHGIWQTFGGLSSDNAPFFLLDHVKETGSRVFQLNLPSSRGVFVVGDAGLCRSVLTDSTCEKAGYFAGKASKISKTVNIVNSFTASAHWKHVRKGTSPAFSSNQVRRMNEICCMHFEQWIQQKQSERGLSSSGIIIEPTREMTQLTTRIVCDAAFEYQATDEEIHDFLYHIDVALHEFASRQLFDPFRRIYGSWTREGRRAEASGAWIRVFASKMLKSYRQSNNNCGSSEKVNSVIRLIDENKNLTEKERVGELIVFLLAGYDTTGYTLSNALVALAENPGVAKKLRTELHKAEQETAEEKTLDAAWHGCDYLHYFIRENFRLYPVAALGSLRQLGHDLKVPISTLDRSNASSTVDKFSASSTASDDSHAIIPAGAAILMPQMILNRNEHVFLDPDKFDPDRWANATKEMNQSLLTFSLGSRNCVGQSLASAEIQSILPRLIRAFDFEVEQTGRPQCFLTFKMGGYRLRMKPASEGRVEYSRDM